MQQRKFCCNGLNARLINTVKPVTKDNAHWKRGLYRCSVCNGWSIRGETLDRPSFTTSVELITADDAARYREEYSEFVARTVHA